MLVFRQFVDDDLGCASYLVGDRDAMERIGRIVYPGRWSSAYGSAWNVARRNGLLRIQRLPCMAHNTPGGYMDANTCGSTGEPNPNVTAREIVAALRAG